MMFSEVNPQKRESVWMDMDGRGDHKEHWEYGSVGGDLKKGAKQG